MDRFAAIADRPAARAAKRAELGLSEADVLVLWVGRLSFFEKAFPQPMIRAVAAAAQAVGVKVAFAMAGWFPNAEDERRYVEVAAAYGGAADVHFLDGNDRALVNDLWSASDIFLSLVDNIQETFGLTPIEAMAAGRPVVASDWDGYRFTVRHEETGFLIPTLSPPSGGGLGRALAARHLLGVDSYQNYVGATAQHTAVHIGRAVTALRTLIAEPERRRQMGAAARQWARAAFDWRIVAQHYVELQRSLAEVRAKATPIPASRRLHPVRGEPFADFGHFATAEMTLETRLSATAATVADLAATRDIALDRAYEGLRAPHAAEAVMRRLQAGSCTVRDLLMTFPVAERRQAELTLSWLAKYGFVDWLA
ncbi:glycosyltransferase family 4 protein [Phenylobacterium sp. J426]|uniref:glycosyltransferase family 4 protein n=1 Tax=Phenylobacterium sp. J426 TaxID=2898439 RepID=UPI002150F62C|nr:glycosyltransferase family 4 protein [Phenylobacterium sp. J426]MCR5876501.1 glycosyltransferase family 4 protein [Phenylobacterium sp. J426]